MTQDEINALKISFDDNSDGFISYGEIESSLKIMVESKLDQVIEKRQGEQKNK